MKTLIPALALALLLAGCAGPLAPPRPTPQPAPDPTLTLGSQLGAEVRPAWTTTLGPRTGWLPAADTPAGSPTQRLENARLGCVAIIDQALTEAYTPGLVDDATASGIVVATFASAVDSRGDGPGLTDTLTLPGESGQPGVQAIGAVVATDRGPVYYVVRSFARAGIDLSAALLCEDGADRDDFLTLLLPHLAVTLDGR